MNSTDFDLKFLPEAKTDLAEIIQYYNGRADQLGQRFFDALADALNLVKKHPFMFAEKHRRLRRAPVKKFPYQIYYLPEPRLSEVQIVAVVHQSRDPKTWMERV